MKLRENLVTGECLGIMIVQVDISYLTNLQQEYIDNYTKKRY